jgi:UDP-3-O-[3-hydroxymyristoyl] glucosamine N-acyltransferase
MSTELYIIGTGAHARKAYECAVEAGWSVKAFVDKTADAISPIAGVPVFAESEVLFSMTPAAVFVAIGDPRTRSAVITRFEAEGWDIPPLVHPKASVSRFAIIEGGVFVAAGAVVEAGTKVGRGAIVDIGMLLDHDCVVEPFAHLRSPVAVLRGNGIWGSFFKEGPAT